MTAACCDPNEDAKLKEPTNIKLVVSIVLINEEGNILIAKRPKGSHMGEYWEFPGGKVHDKETPESAVIREAKEELGVSTCAGCLLPLTFVSHPYDDFHLMMPIFACRNWEGEVVGAEGQEIKWIAVNTLKDYPMPPANRKIIGMVRDLLGSS
tara:strand:- start:618 stop:1076 length:459 start_codon:yes stop_codon:yes gene_type:complete